MSVTAAHDLLLADADAVLRNQLAACLRRMRKAARRIDQRESGDALHDFRVPLRRLLSLERGFRRQIESPVPKKLRRRLRALLAMTGPARDAEVQLGWIRQQMMAIGPEMQRCVALVEAEMRSRLRRQHKCVRRRLDKTFADVRTDLKQRLARRNDAQPASYAQLAANEIERQSAVLVAALSELLTQQDLQSIHPVRILAKRLRVVLDPWRDAVPALRAPANSLVRIQEHLGRIHDMQMLRAALDGMARDVSAGSTALASPAKMLSRRATAQERRAGATLWSARWKQQAQRLQQQFDVGVRTLRLQSAADLHGVASSAIDCGRRDPHHEL